MGEHSGDLIVLSEKRAAAIAGVSAGRLLYWRLTGVVQPEINRQLSLRNGVRLYTLQDMIALLITAELRRRRFPLQQVRRVVEHLRSRGYADPLRELRFATHRKVIYFQHPDGSWEGAGRPDQTVIQEVIDLETIRTIIRAGARRPAESYGKIERRRSTVGSKPVFAGTRIPVATVAGWLASGHTAEQVIEQYPDLVPADIDAARKHAVSA